MQYVIINAENNFYSVSLQGEFSKLSSAAKLTKERARDVVMFIETALHYDSGLEIVEIENIEATIKNRLAKKLSALNAQIRAAISQKDSILYDLIIF